MTGWTGWYGVDLDGVLAHYERWVDEDTIGEPVPRMVARVKGWLDDGRTVKIFTARVAGNNSAARIVVERWCKQHLGQVLEVTNEKDMGLIELWDDRCVQVVPNMGMTLAEYESFKKYGAVV
jgi:hypothetical protein